MAAVLNIALAGPRYYEGKKIDYPYVNVNARHQLSTEDIRRSVSTLNIVWVGFSVILLLGILIY